MTFEQDVKRLYTKYAKLEKEEQAKRPKVNEIKKLHQLLKIDQFLANALDY
jgi:hypothetical protein